MEFQELISSEFRVALSERQDFLKEWITRCLEGPVFYRVASAPVVDSMELEVKQLSDLTEKENMFTNVEKLELIAAIRSPGDQGNNWKHYSNPLVPILRERLSNPPKVQVYHPESIVGELFHEPNNGVSPLREEENVDSNSIDSSNTMRVSTSLLSANAVGKCSNLHMTCCGFSKEAGEKTPHVAINPFQILVEEKTELYSSGPSEITVFSSPRLAGPSIFNFSGLSGWTIPSSSSNSSSLWILDSGAAHHACYSQASFESFVRTSGSCVTLPNGHTVPVDGTGSVRLCDDLTLQNVLFVPQFHCNLLSISALTQQYPYDVSFSSDQYIIKDRTQGRTIAIGRRAVEGFALAVALAAALAAAQLSQDIPEKFHREDLEEKVTNHGVSAESKRMCEANEYFQSPEEEKMKPYAEYISKIMRSEQLLSPKLQPTTLGTLDPQPGGSSEITVFSSPRLAGPSIFNFSGPSGWTIPSSSSNSSSSNSSSLWILDSGATNHACCSRASFESFVPIFHSPVSLPNGLTVPVDGTGSVRLCDDLTLQNVLFVPQLHCNLLSISALTQQQYPYDVSFSSDEFVIKDRTQGRTIAIGRRAGNLYILDSSIKYTVFPLRQSEPPF